MEHERVGPLRFFGIEVGTDQKLNRRAALEQALRMLVTPDCPRGAGRVLAQLRRGGGVEIRPQATPALAREVNVPPGTRAEENVPVAQVVQAENGAGAEEGVGRETDVELERRMQQAMGPGPQQGDEGRPLAEEVDIERRMQAVAEQAQRVEEGAGRSKRKKRGPSRAVSVTEEAPVIAEQKRPVVTEAEAGGVLETEALMKRLVDVLKLQLKVMESQNRAMGRLLARARAAEGDG